MNLVQDSVEEEAVSSSKKRKLRRKKLKEILICKENLNNPNIFSQSITNNCKTNSNQLVTKVSSSKESNENSFTKEETVKMSSNKSRDEVLAAREAKKLSKQKGKKEPGQIEEKTEIKQDNVKGDCNESKETLLKIDTKSKDEVDRAGVKVEGVEGSKSKEQVLAERAAKKAAKQAKKKPINEVVPNPDMTIKDVVETLKDIKIVAKDAQDLTAKAPENEEHIAKADVNKNKAEDVKSKAELRAERRAKQEAQRAAKQTVVDEKQTKVKAETIKPKADVKAEKVKEKSPKPKQDKSKVAGSRVNWFQHLNTEHNMEALSKVTVNSNLHPAIIKLGVQLASRVIEGANARCIALLNALKQMVRDYSLPAKTEFARGLESHLAASLQFLWSLRQPSASQTNAIQYFRHQLTQLPNNVDEFDAKKTLQEEIDKYIEDQIDKAGEAISMAVRKKISNGDRILTYGCSSLIERILKEAYTAGVEFHTVVVGDTVHAGGRELLRRLVAHGLACTYVDITALSFVMKTIKLVVLGAEALLANGCVLGRAGSATAALCGRAHNVPVLVAIETHKVSPKVCTDGFVYNEIGDPDALIDKSDENSPLKDWRSNPNLTLINLTYDVTPPSLVTAVVTEKAILPCTSAPVVLRTKLSEYGI